MIITPPKNHMDAIKLDHPDETESEKILEKTIYRTKKTETTVVINPE